MKQVKQAAVRILAAVLCAGVFVCAGTFLYLGNPGAPAFAEFAAFADESPSSPIGRLTLTESSLWEVGAVALGDTKRLDELSVTHRVIVLISIPGEEDYTDAFQISFDTSEVNINTCGTYHMPAILPLPEPFDKYENDLADFIVEVFDPAIPRIYSAGYAYAWGIGLSYYISYTYTGTLDELRFWRSDDSGTTWHAYWDGATGEQESENLEVQKLPGDRILDVTFYDPDTELSGEVMLAFEVPARGTGSEILCLNLDAGSVTNGIGGDRDGGDRIRLPWQKSILGGSKGGGSEDEGEGEDEGSGDSDGKVGDDGFDGADRGAGSGSEDGGADDGAGSGSGADESSGGGYAIGGNGEGGYAGDTNAGLILSGLPGPVRDAGTGDTTSPGNARDDAQKPSGIADTIDTPLAPLIDKPITLTDTAGDEEFPPRIFVTLVITLLLILAAVAFVRRFRRNNLGGS